MAAIKMKTTKLGLLIFALLVVLFTANNSFAATLKFAQITDIHYSPDGITDSKRDVSSSSNNLKFAINSLNKQDISFAVFLGDNIDRSRPQSLLPFLQMTQQLTVPHYFVIGNHDAYKLTGIQKEDYIKAVNIYNPHQKSQKPYYYFFPNKDCIAIVVDGATTFAPSTHGLYTESMIEWLDDVLKRHPNRIALIFQHFPLIPPVENRSHETLKADKYMELLIKHKNIALISSGHFHNDKLTIDDNGIYHISVPSLLSPPNEYQIVEINYDKARFKKPTNINIKIDKIKI